MIEIHPALVLHVRRGTLADFILPYELIATADAHTIESAGLAGSKLAQQLGEAMTSLRGIDTRLAAAWSAETPIAALARLAHAGARTVEKLAHQADRLTQTSLTIRAIQRRADAHIAVINKEAAHLSYAIDGSSIPNHLPQRSHQTASLLNGLARDLELEQHRVCDYILADDIRQWIDVLPALAPASYRLPLSWPLSNEQPTASGTDTQLRKQVQQDLLSDNPAVRSLAQALNEELARAAADGSTVQLLRYDPTAFAGLGNIAYTIGDIATSDSVATLVSGVRSSPRDTSGHTAAAKRLQHAAAAAGAKNPVVVVTFPYQVPGSSPAGPDLPDLRHMLREDRAAAAATSYAEDLSFFKSLARPGATMTAFGFSYGGLVTMQALRAGATVDAAVIAGSPGAGKNVSTKFSFPNLAPGGLAATKAQWDLVTSPAADIAASVASGSILMFDLKPYGSDLTKIGAVEIDNRHSGSGHSLDVYTSGGFLEATASLMAGKYDKALPAPLPGLGYNVFRLFTEERFGN